MGLYRNLAEFLYAELKPYLVTDVLVLRTCGNIISYLFLKRKKHFY